MTKTAIEVYPPARILLVDDDPQSLASTRKILELSEYDVTVATDGQAALEQIRAARFDVVVSDVRMPRLGGLEFLRALSLCGETAPVILMTAFGRVEDAVWAMKFGAVDFLTKPFRRAQLLESVEMALRRARAAAIAVGAVDGNAAGVSDLAAGGPTAALIGRSRAMQELRETIAQVGPTAATVLLTGESGTGKELVARCLHRSSTRRQAELVALNCAAVPETLIESELFGFEKGSFTGAVAARTGLFEAADQSTLLLDEIGDMPLALQATLLRTLQEGEVRRIGATTPKKVDVRLIAATHRDLRELVRTGAFRPDLMYRLEVIAIAIPPLRERAEDIAELARHFLEVASRRHGKIIGAISRSAMSALEAHSWPGNVRELANVVERAVVFAKSGEVTPAELPAHLRHLGNSAIGLTGHSTRDWSGREDVLGSPGSLAPPSSQTAPGTVAVPLGTSLRDVEDLLIRKTLEATDGDKNMTAKLLGINSRTIYRKLDRKPEPG